MTDNLVWVVDPETHPGASRHPPDGGDFQRSHPCRFAAPASCLLSGCHMQSESGWLSDSIGGGAYYPLLGLPAAFTRLPPIRPAVLRLVSAARQSLDSPLQRASGSEFNLQ